MRRSVCAMFFVVMWYDLLRLRDVALSPNAPTCKNVDAIKRSSDQKLSAVKNDPILAKLKARPNHSQVPEYAAGRGGPCMLVCYEVPYYTPSISDRGSASRAHRTRILETYGLGGLPSQQQRCQPCKTCNKTYNLRPWLAALTTLTTASLETVLGNMLRIEE